MSQKCFKLVLLASTSVTMAASCSPTVVLPTPPAMTAVSAKTTPAVDKTDPIFPQLIAHRGGTSDRPENTLAAIDAALANKADMIWLTVQLSADGIPVLYRPTDLSALTDGKGPVAGQTFAQLRQWNAGWNFSETDAAGTKRYPYRDNPVSIPSLEQALQRIPRTVPVVLDMKAMPAEAQTEAVARLLERDDAWGRVLIYSTEAAYQKTFARYPKARVFESRDGTRQRLVEVALAGTCNAPGTGIWAGFEMRRKVSVTEQFTLGEGKSGAMAAFWSAPAVACFRSRNAVNLVAFGVNDQAAYCEAMRLGLDAVMVDSPARMSAIRAQLKETPEACPPAR